MVPESVGQVVGFALFAAAPALGAGRRFRDRVLGITVFHDPQVALVESVEILGMQAGLDTHMTQGVSRAI